MNLVSRGLVENCKCEVVDFSEISEIIKYGEKMNKIMVDNNGIGLAAPQVGIFKRFFILRDFQSNGYELIINPEITWESPKLESFKEGCLTYNTKFEKPEYVVKRPKSIIASWTDKNGNTTTKNMRRMTAEVFHHEYEHLNGITIFNRETK